MALLLGLGLGLTMVQNPPRDGSAELPAIAGVYNFVKANTTNAIAAKGAMLEGLADMRIAYIGDSTAFGQNSTSQGTTNAKTNSVSQQLADLLNAASVPASSDDLWGNGAAGTPSATMANFLLSEPRVTREGSAWTVQSFPCIGGRAIGVSGSNSTDTMTFATGRSANMLDVYFLRFTSGGSFVVSVDGGAESTPQSTLGANGMEKVTLYLGSSAAHTVRFRCSSTPANVFLIGLAFYDTNARRATIWNHGACGYTSATVDSKTAAWDWGNQIANANLGLHLAIIEGCLVNDRSAFPDPAASMTRIQSWITALKAQNCDVWLVNPEPVSDSTTTSRAYQSALQALANTNSVPFVDFMLPHDTVTEWQGAGYGDPADLIHPNGAGYGFIAARFAAMLEAL